MPSRDRDERELDAVRSPPGGDSEQEALHRLGAVARALTDDDLDLRAPPAGLWEGVAARVAAEAGAAGAPPDGEAGGRVVRVARWWWSGPRVLAAAAVVVLAGLVAGLVVVRRAGDELDVVATVDLEPLAAVPGASGRLVDADGELRLDLDTDVEAPVAGAFYEVWLIDEAVEGMVSLGPLRLDGTYELPAGIDYARYPIVDVSVEPDDGDPAHSGASILRGVLES